MDAPLSYIHMPSACGWFALGLLIGVVFATIYWFFIYGRAWVNINDLRAVYPGWKFTRGRYEIMGYWHGRIYTVGNKYSTFATVCDKVDSIIEQRRY